MTNKVEISKIQIKIGPKTIELTLAELKELKKVLDDLVCKENIPYYYTYPPYKPKYYEDSSIPSPLNPGWTVTCENSVLSLALK